MSPNELLHSVAGLYSVALPDIELNAVYNSLTNGSHTLALVTSTDSKITNCIEYYILIHLSHSIAAVLKYRKAHPLPPSLEETTKTDSESDSIINKNENENDKEEDEASFFDIYSDSDDDDEDEERWGEWRKYAVT